MLVLASKLGKHDIYESGQLQKLNGNANCLPVQIELLVVAETFVEDAMEEILSSVLLGRDGVSKPSSTPEAERQLDGNNKCLLNSFAFSHQLL